MNTRQASRSSAVTSTNVAGVSVAAISSAASSTNVAVSAIAPIVTSTNVAGAIAPIVTSTNVAGATMAAMAPIVSNGNIGGRGNGGGRGSSGGQAGGGRGNGGRGNGQFRAYDISAEQEAAEVLQNMHRPVKVFDLVENEPIADQEFKLREVHRRYQAMSENEIYKAQILNEFEGMIFGLMNCILL